MIQSLANGIARKCEYRFISSIKNLRNSESKVQRELVSRIAVFASLFFLSLAVFLRFAAMFIDLATSLKSRSWQVLKERNIDNCRRVFHCLAGAVLAIPVGLYSPQLLVDFIGPVHSIAHQKIAQAALSSMTSEEMDRNWKLDEIFGQVRFINLDGHTERLEGLFQSLKSIGLKKGLYSRYSGCIGTNLPKETYDRMRSNYKKIDASTESGRRQLDRQHMGQMGCYLSHYLLIKETASNYELAEKKLNALPWNASVEERRKAEDELRKYSSILILEDDARFGRILPEHITELDGGIGAYSDTFTHKGNGKIFYEAMKDLPENWDMLHFVTINIREPAKTSNKHLLQLKESMSLVAYAVSARMYPKLLKQLEKIETIPTCQVDAIDEEIVHLQKNSHCYAIFPPLVGQGTDSIINGVQSDPDSRRTYWQGGISLSH